MSNANRQAHARFCHLKLVGSNGGDYIGRSSDDRSDFPRVEGFHAVVADLKCGTAADGNGETVAYGREPGHIPLHASRSSDPLHASVSLAEGQVTVFGTLVQTFVGAVLELGQDLAFRSALRP